MQEGFSIFNQGRNQKSLPSARRIGVNLNLSARDQVRRVQSSIEVYILKTRDMPFGAGSKKMSSSQIVSGSVAWQTGAAEPREAFTGWLNLPKKPVPMPQDLGKGFFEALSPKPGMGIVRGSHQFAPQQSGRLAPIGDTCLALNEPAILIQSAAAGRAIVKDKILQREHTLSDQQSIIQCVEDVSFSRIHDTSFNNDFYYLVLTLSTLYDLLGEGNAEQFLRAQKLISSPSANTLDLPYGVSNILHSCMKNQSMGEFRKLYAQGAILEYFSFVSNHVLGTPRSSSCSRKTRIVRQLHEELMNLDGDVPSLLDLSQKYGLSTRTLNEAFKSEYGQSIYAYVKDQRLAKAHSVILETNTPIKIVAADYGYAHVTNFMLAFKKKYGYSAGSLRR